VIPDDWFLHYFLKDPENKEVFEMLENIYNFVPYSIQEETRYKKDPPIKRLYAPTVRFIFNADPYIVCILTNKKNKHHELPKRKCGCNPPKPPKEQTVAPSNEIWMEKLLSQTVLCPLFSSKCEKLPELIKEDGNALFSLIKGLSRPISHITKPEFSTDLLAYCYKALFNDLITPQPEPTEEEPNPKQIPTLFQDVKGNVHDPFALAKAKNVNKNSIKNMKKRFNNSKNIVTTQTGKPCFVPTKNLLGNLSSICLNPSIIKTIKYDIFIPYMDLFLAFKSNEQLDRIGNDNDNHFADYFVKSIFEMLDFGDTIKPIDWIKTVPDHFTVFFKLFTSDSFHHISLEVVNQFLLNLPDQKSRDSIITSFISATNSLDIPFSLHSRSRVISWSLDPHYVGYPIPKYSIDYVNEIVNDTKLHIDLRRTIAASIIAYYKNLNISGYDPIQTDEMFQILIKIYELSRDAMAPVFCQLIRPNYCKELRKTNQNYHDILSTASFPELFISPQNFGDLSVPHKGGDKWNDFYTRYVVEFIIKSLSCKDGRVIGINNTNFNKDQCSSW